jgi:hypothetical protein
VQGHDAHDWEDAAAPAAAPGDLEFQLPRDGGGGSGLETPTDRKRRAAATKADRCAGWLQA